MNTKTTYYNEFDPFAAQWLQNLVDAGHISQGTVDSRSILDVDEVPDGPQAHFFAGIGVWSYALRLAGVPDDYNVWTGSCPCQPFSVAGKQQGVDDERHLWPEWRRLIAKHRPAILFGEQVASKAGKDWLSDVRLDLEALGYAVGAADLCAASVGAPHVRQRLFFGAVRLADGGIPRLEGHAEHVGDGSQSRRIDSHAAGSTSSGGVAGGLEHPHRLRLRQEVQDVWNAKPPGPGARYRVEAAFGAIEAHRLVGDGADWLLCRDPSNLPRWRPVESNTLPLAYGVAGDVGRLRAYGNAIVPQVAAHFIQAFMDALDTEAL